MAGLAEDLSIESDDERVLVGQSSLLAFLNERLLSATSGHRIDFKDRALMINKSVALPDQIFARPELA